MWPDRQIVRVVAAMILAIIAYVAPSVVQAHEGHAHHGHRLAAAQPKAAAPAKPAVRAEAPARFKAARATVEEARIGPAGDGCCRPGCKARCCGTMACCATGILAGSDALSPALFLAATLIPRDVAGRAGIGPAALPKPPRTPA